MAERALTVPECALRLGISRRQLERHLRSGAPRVRAGRRGRGGAALVDPAAVKAFIAIRSGTDDTEARMRALAADIPNIIAATLYRRCLNVEGPHKRALGMELQLTWGFLTESLLARLRHDVPDLPDAPDVPAAIVQIAHGCRI